MRNCVILLLACLLLAGLFACGDPVVDLTDPGGSATTTAADGVTDTTDTDITETTSGPSVETSAGEGDTPGVVTTTATGGGARQGTAATKPTTTTAAKKDRGVKLSTAQEALAFIRKGNFTMTVRPGDGRGSPELCAVKDNQLRMGDYIFTREAMYALDPARKEYTGGLPAPLPLWLRVTDEAVSKKPRKETSGGKDVRIERLTMGEEYVDFCFLDGYLYSIHTCERVPADGGGKELANSRLLVDSISDKADGALFSLEGYKDVTPKKK